MMIMLDKLSVPLTKIEYGRSFFCINPLASGLYRREDEASLRPQTLRATYIDRLNLRDGLVHDFKTDERGLPVLARTQVEKLSRHARFLVFHDGRPRIGRLHHVDKRAWVHDLDTNGDFELRINQDVFPIDEGTLGGFGPYAVSLGWLVERIELSRNDDRWFWPVTVGHDLDGPYQLAIHHRTASWRGSGSFAGRQRGGHSERHLFQHGEHVVHCSNARPINEIRLGSMIVLQRETGPTFAVIGGHNETMTGIFLGFRDPRPLVNVPHDTLVASVMPLVEVSKELPPNPAILKPEIGSPPPIAASARFQRTFEALADKAARLQRTFEALADKAALQGFVDVPGVDHRKELEQALSALEDRWRPADGRLDAFGEILTRIAERSQPAARACAYAFRACACLPLNHDRYRYLENFERAARAEMDVIYAERFRTRVEREIQGT